MIICQLFIVKLMYIILELKKVYSLEHIYPISHMTNDAKVDMHNLFKTTKFLNNARSNYKFTDYENIFSILIIHGWL